MRLFKLIFFVAIGAALPFAGETVQAQISGFGGFAAVNNTGGGSSINATTLQFSNGGGSQDTSAFFPTAQNIGAFSATYTYQATSGADGVAFIFQNDARGTTALGGNGGGLGYGTDNLGTAIQPSTALELNIYTGNSSFPMGENFLSNGATNAYNATNNPPTNNGVNLSSNNQILVNLNYDGTTLRESIRDTGSNHGYTNTYVTNIPATVGSSTALVGFSGATGGISSTQSVSSFSFTYAPTYYPIPVTGYNQKMIVPQNATNPIQNTTTATLDQGTNNGGDTFYEQGLNSGFPASGTVHPGGTFVSSNDPNHVYQMAPSYTANDALLLDGTSSSSVATLSLPSPKDYSALSFLVDSGGGSDTFTAVVHHLGGGTETFTTLNAHDWFNGDASLGGGNSPIAYVLNARVSSNAGNPQFDNVASGNPRMYQQDVTLADIVDPVTSVDFFISGTSPTNPNTGHAVVWAVSGIAVPEPGSCLLLAIGAASLAAVARRKRTR